MKKHSLWLALPAIVTTIAFAQPSAAAPVTYTFTGVVDFGTDDFGIFGAAGGSLNGAGFTAVFTRDDALALPEDIFLGETNTFVKGFGEHQPLTAVLTINGVDYALGGEYAEQSQYDDGFYEGFNLLTGGPGSSLSLGGTTLGTFAATSFDYLAGPDYHTLATLSADDTPGFAWFGNFELLGPTRDGPRTFASFNPTNLVVSPNPVPGAVPEPATWAMMITGFGGVGWTLRRRRGMAAFA